jgi:hypothetical protein
MRSGKKVLFHGVCVALVVSLFAAWLSPARSPIEPALAGEKGRAVSLGVSASGIGQPSATQAGTSRLASRASAAASSPAAVLYGVTRANDLLLEGRYPADLVGDQVRLLLAAIALCDSVKSSPADAMPQDEPRMQYLRALEAHRPYIDRFCSGFEEYAAHEYLGVLIQRRDAMSEESLIRHAETAWSSSQHSLPDDAYIRELQIGMRRTTSPDRFERSALIALHAGLPDDASSAERDRLRGRVSENPAIAHYAAVVARCEIFGGCGAGSLLAYQACLPNCPAGVRYGDGIVPALSVDDLQLARHLAARLVEGME